MVNFNGVDLTDIAPAEIGYVEIQNPKIDTTSVDRPQRNGSYFVRRRVKERKIVVTFTLFDDSMEQRDRYAAAVRAWCSTNAPAPLYLPHHDGEYLMAVCTDVPDFNTLERWETLKMTFTAFDPEWISGAEMAAACGAPFLVGGSEPPLIQLKHTVIETLDGISWTLDELHTFSLAGAVTPGEIIVDFNRKTITLDGLSVMDQFPLTQDIPDILPGVHTITGSGKLCWRERWI